MTDTYDPKAKKIIDSVTIDGLVLKPGDRVRYTSGGVFAGRVGVLKKLKREWHSARSMSRAGFAGEPGGYAITALVLWDENNGHGPQSCSPKELAHFHARNPENHE